MYDTLRRHFEKIVPLNDAEFAVIADCFLPKKFKKRQLLVEVGEPVAYNYFIVSGLTKLVYTDETAKEHILAFALEDWWDNDTQAWLSQTPATLSLECIEDTEVLCLSLQNYYALLKQFPKLEGFFLQKVTSGLLAAQRRILSLLTTNVQERYEQLIRQHPALLQRVPKTQLAAYLGVSREALSRLKF